MRLNHPDYIKLVFETFKKLRVDGKLSPLLNKSTPTNIRKECLNVYKERDTKKDDLTLRAFFGPADDRGEFKNAILNFETNKFKPLDNYLKGNTENTDDSNLEILAWLINFRHRPFRFENNILLSDEELSLIDNSTNNPNEKEPVLEPVEDGVQKEEEEEEENLSKNETEEIPRKNEEDSQVFSTGGLKNNNWRDRIKKPAIFFLILMICTGGTYIIWQEKREQAGCMYWAYDHYEKVACNEDDKGREIRPFNEKRFANFKRITKEDTITEKSIDIIFSVKIDAGYEFYTTGGKHPIIKGRNLSPLSRYVFDKYLGKKETTKKIL